jgi:hypothetical protein
MEAMMDILDTLTPYIPLLQTLSWIALAAIGSFVFRQQIKLFADVVRARIEQGSGLKAGPLEIGQDLRTLEQIEKEPVVSGPEQNGSTDRTIDEWNRLRHGVYQHNREVFLAHIIRPLQAAVHEYDVYIYLVRHDSQDLSDVKYAEFFLGKHWGNQIFQERYKEHERNGLIGVATSAPGPFLCTCRVTFKDGKKIDLHRYVDFEMNRAFKL